MPRQHTHHSRITYVFPDDFPQRLVRFKEESGLPWAELKRRLDTDPETIRRWRDKGVRPSTRHMMALLVLADSMVSATCSPTREAVMGHNAGA